MDLTFLGTNTLFITKGASSLMIDPHFTRPGLLKLLTKIAPDKKKIRSGLTILGVDTLDGVLLTHTHYDHAMDAMEVIQQAGGVLYGSGSAANLARGADLSKDNYRVVTPNDQVSIGAFSVTWLGSRHISFPPPLGWFMPEEGRINQPITPPLHIWKYKSGAVFGILIDHLLVFGSAGFFPNAYQECNAESVVLSIGGLETKPIHYLEKLYNQTVIQTGAQQVLISHLDNFFQPLSDNIQAIGLANFTIQRLSQLGARYGQTVKVLLPGERIKI